VAAPASASAGAAAGIRASSAHGAYAALAVLADERSPPGRRALASHAAAPALVVQHAPDEDPASTAGLATALVIACLSLALVLLARRRDRRIKRKPRVPRWQRKAQDGLGWAIVSRLARHASLMWCWARLPSDILTCSQRCAIMATVLAWQVGLQALVLGTATTQAGGAGGTSVAAWPGPLALALGLALGASPLAEWLLVSFFTRLGNVAMKNSPPMGNAFEQRSSTSHDVAHARGEAPTPRPLPAPPPPARAKAPLSTKKRYRSDSLVDLIVSPLGPAEDLVEPGQLLYSCPRRVARSGVGGMSKGRHTATRRPSTLQRIAHAFGSNNSMQSNNSGNSGDSNTNSVASSVTSVASKSSVSSSRIMSRLKLRRGSPPDLSSSHAHHGTLVEVPARTLVTIPTPSGDLVGFFAHTERGGFAAAGIGGAMPVPVTPEEASGRAVGDRLWMRPLPFVSAEDLASGRASEQGQRAVAAAEVSSAGSATFRSYLPAWLGGPSTAGAGSVGGGGTGGGGGASHARRSSAESESQLRTRALVFNAESSGAKGMRALRDKGLLPEDTAEARALFLLEAGPRLRPDAVMDYLGSAENGDDLRLFMQGLDFKNARLDSALRRLNSVLRLRAEAAKLDRVLSAFAEAYHAQNPRGAFASPDQAHMAASSLLLLNADAHNPKVRRKMPKDSFADATVQNGLPRALMETLFDAVTQLDLRVEERPSMQVVREGWVRKRGRAGADWTPRFAVLSTRALYLYDTAWTAEPSQILPLEHTLVARAGATRLVVSLLPHNTSGAGGGGAQGREVLASAEQVLLIDAASHADADDWARDMRHFTLQEGALFVPDEDIPAWEVLAAGRRRHRRSSGAAVDVDAPRPPNCPPLRFVQARGVRAAPSLSRRDAAARFCGVGKLAPQAASVTPKIGIPGRDDLLVPMVTVELFEAKPLPARPWLDGFGPLAEEHSGGRALDDYDIVLDASAARAELLRALERAPGGPNDLLGTHPARAAAAIAAGGASQPQHGLRHGTPQSTRSGRSSRDEVHPPSDTSDMSDAREMDSEAGDATAIASYARLSYEDLREAALWWRHPRERQVALAWALLATLALSAFGAILAAAFTLDPMPSASAWMDAVVAMSAIGQAAKLLVLEPCVALLALLPNPIAGLLPLAAAKHLDAIRVVKPPKASQHGGVGGSGRGGGQSSAGGDGTPPANGSPEGTGMRMTHHSAEKIVTSV